jgi:hypothetical protein
MERPRTELIEDLIHYNSGSNEQTRQLAQRLRDLRSECRYLRTATTSNLMTAGSTVGVGAAITAVGSIEASKSFPDSPNLEAVAFWAVGVGTVTVGAFIGALGVNKIMEHREKTSEAQGLISALTTHYLQTQLARIK